MENEPRYQVVQNSLGTLAWIKVQHDNGRWYAPIEFHTNPFASNPKALFTYSDGKEYHPQDVQAVKVLECWRDGGLALVTWIDGNVKEVAFGKRKPGTASKASGPRRFPVSRSKDGRRRNY